LPLLMGLVLAIVTAIPYAYAYAVQSPGHVFLGFFYLGDDANTYLAKMRQGWEGAWAWQNRYTTESSPTAYLFMFWIVLGHIAALGVVLTLTAIQRGSLTLGVLAGLAWLGQASIHPQMPILMGGATALALLLRPARPRGWVAGALAFAIPAPYILYSYLAFVGNPEVQRWTFHSKNALPPESISLFFAIAPQLLLALTGLPGALRRR